MLIKIGIRKNLLYPFLFMVLSNILIIINIIFGEIIKNELIIILFSLLNIISNIIINLVFLYFFHFKEKTIKNDKEKKILGIELIQYDNELNMPDGSVKIFLLIGLDSFFDLIGSLRRLYFLLVIKEGIELLNLDIRIKNREIIFAAILCHFTLRTNLYKHHIISLVIITVCIIVLYGIEILIQIKKNQNKSLIFPFLGVQIIVNITRVFSDIIEKYLMDTDFINPFKLLEIKNIIELILISFFYIFYQTQKEILFLINLEAKIFYIGLALLFMHFIISGITNIYKIYTIKFYSPLARALFDSILDFTFFIYFSFNEDSEDKKVNTYYFWINIILQLIIVFFSLVYNEFLVLYFWGMHTNTHLEIASRSLLMELNLENNSDIRLSVDELD